MTNVTNVILERPTFKRKLAYACQLFSTGRYMGSQKKKKKKMGGRAEGVRESPSW